MTTSRVIKSLALALLLGGSSIGIGGCATGMPDLLAPPGYTSSENAQRIWRYADYDRSQAVDDFDRQITMTRPHSFTNPWALSHHD